jgi:hypothetical protein
MKSDKACEKCVAADSANGTPETAKPIGEEVTIRHSMSSGHMQTDHAFLQCSACGSVWVTYEDSGAGGHGRFSRRLTKDLF